MSRPQTSIDSFRKKNSNKQKEDKTLIGFSCSGEIRCCCCSQPLRWSGESPSPLAEGAGSELSDRSGEWSAPGADVLMWAEQIVTSSNYHKGNLRRWFLAYLQWGSRDWRPRRKAPQRCAEEHPAAPPSGRRDPLHSNCLGPDCQRTDGAKMKRAFNLRLAVGNRPKRIQQLRERSLRGTRCGEAI